MKRHYYFAVMCLLPAMLLHPACAAADELVAGHVTGMDLSSRLLVIDGVSYKIPATLVSNVEAGRRDWGLALGSRVVAGVAGPRLTGIRPDDSPGRMEPVNGLPQ